MEVSLDLCRARCRDTNTIDTGLLLTILNRKLRSRIQSSPSSVASPFPFIFWVGEKGLVNPTGISFRPKIPILGVVGSVRFLGPATTETDRRL